MYRPHIEVVDSSYWGKGLKTSSYLGDWYRPVNRILLLRWLRSSFRLPIRYPIIRSDYEALAGQEASYYVADTTHIHGSANMPSETSNLLDENKQPRRESTDDESRFIRSSFGRSSNWTESLRRHPGVYPAALLIRDAILGSAADITEAVFEGVDYFDPYSRENTELVNWISRICSPRCRAQRSFAIVREQCNTAEQKDYDLLDIACCSLQLQERGVHIFGG